MVGGGGELEKEDREREKGVRKGGKGRVGLYLGDSGLVMVRAESGEGRLVSGR